MKKIIFGTIVFFSLFSCQEEENGKVVEEKVVTEEVATLSKEDKALLEESVASFQTLKENLKDENLVMKLSKDDNGKLFINYERKSPQNEMAARVKTPELVCKGKSASDPEFAKCINESLSQGICLQISTCYTCAYETECPEKYESIKDYEDKDDFPDLDFYLD
ncbi:hypothetical protein [Ornithobacterium rhinotracheale]